ncbi:histidine phosphatase family protein [Nocardia sp. NPDC052112]|uniref:histidine phosphatase family protein n=1 Tax=Nocardia sp. NPDC052112 TaxID=3155646 RepID=UPI003448DA0A
MPWSPLTAAGRRQAVGATRALADAPIVRVNSSNALRARQTADVLASGHGLDVVALDELAEVGIGEFEGSGDPAVLRRAAEVLRAWIVEVISRSGSAMVSRVGRWSTAWPGVRR